MTFLLLRLQKHPFFLYLPGVLLLSLSLAYLVSVVINYYLLTKQQDSAAVTLQPAQKPAMLKLPPKPPYEDFENVLSSRLFQLSPDTGQKETKESSVAADVKDIQLLGVVAGSPVFARALIRIKENNHVQEYGIGESPGGNKILRILPFAILIQRGNTTMMLEVGADTSQPQTQETATPKEDSKPAGNVQKVPVKRSRILQLTKNQNKLYENKFAPITRNEKVVGIKAIFIPANSILYELGARTGDIIRRINGQPVDDMNKLMELWQNVQTLNKISVDLERGGKIFSYEIEIQD